MTTSMEPKAIREDSEIIENAREQDRLKQSLETYFSLINFYKKFPKRKVSNPEYIKEFARQFYEEKDILMKYSPEKTRCLAEKFYRLLDPITPSLAHQLYLLAYSNNGREK